MKPLSPKQLALMELLIGGTRQKQAAEKLGISETSAAVHVARARVKLGAKTRDQAMYFFAVQKVKEEI